MTTQLLPFAIVIAITAAVRSTWSPCGLSMLSVITPMSERGRGRNFLATSAWFVVGAIVGGVTLGVLAAAVALAVHATGLVGIAAVGVGAIATFVCAASDLKVGGFQLPGHTRQVNEYWLDMYRGWVYGVGFGWQIGVGLSTYIMTAAVYLTTVLAALTGSPMVAFGVCVLFGAVRGVMILLTIRVHTPEQLRSFHRRFAELRAPFRMITIAIELVVAVAMAAVAWGIVGAVGGIALAAIGVVSRRSRADRVIAEPRDPIAARAA